MRLKRRVISMFDDDHCPINDKNLNNEIETCSSSVKITAPSPINDKNLNNEIETLEQERDKITGNLTINDKNLNNEIETFQTDKDICLYCC